MLSKLGEQSLKNLAARGKNFSNYVRDGGEACGRNMIVVFWESSIAIQRTQFNLIDLLNFV